jgi:glycosyltransferase involved in cell wall biosynthesis
MPTLSCIVPVYNSETYLGQALDSILEQTLPPTEIIVIDDGSTDATPMIAAKYARHVSYIRQENRGPAGARNAGLRVSDGDFLTFLDADDTWHPEKLERQMRALEAEPEAGICITHVQNFWIEALAHERARLDGHPFTRPAPGYVCQALLARRRVFDQVGSFDETLRIGEDTDWFTRVAGAGIRKIVLPDVLVNRRIHGKNISFEMYSSQDARAALLENVIRHIKQQRTGASRGN